LRQVGQRITLSYQLSPLTFNECKEYIQYRINIAAQKSAIKFDRAAYRTIFKYSKGIPRLINIVCDRSLLTAFVMNQFKISAHIAKASVKELASRGQPKSDGITTGKWALIGISFLSVVFLVAVFYQPIREAITAPFAGRDNLQTNMINQTVAVKAETKDPAPRVEVSDPVDEAEAPPVKNSLPTVSLAEYLKHMDGRSSRQPALMQAMKLWQTSAQFTPYLKDIDDDQTYFRLSAKPSGMFIHRLETDMAFIKKLNLPAILEFYPPGSSSPGYLTLTRLDGDKIMLKGKSDTEWIATDLEELEFYWSGVAYLPWKNFHSIWGTIPTQSYKDSVITLKLLLQDIGYQNVAIDEKYDEFTQNAVESIQAKYGIPVDGYVGPLTKIILYREKNSFQMPRLTESK
ncbi:MAG: peptidoglycan-binding protein, partial [Desulfobacterales bacterium]